MNLKELYDVLRDTLDGRSRGGWERSTFPAVHHTLGRNPHRPAAGKSCRGVHLVGRRKVLFAVDVVDVVERMMVPAGLVVP